MTHVRPSLLFPGLAILSLAAGMFALVSGSAEINVGEVWQALAGSAPDYASNIIMDLRLPRALTAFGVGGLLAADAGQAAVTRRHGGLSPAVFALDSAARFGKPACQYEVASLV